MKPLKKIEIIEYLNKGWQLGTSSGFSGKSAWLQRELCCGGDSFTCHLGSFYSLLRKNIIRQLPRQKDDLFWLTRYGLSKKASQP
jgi:hypothetical protein